MDKFDFYNNPAPEDDVLARREVQNVRFQLEKRQERERKEETENEKTRIVEKTIGNTTVTTFQVKQKRAGFLYNPN